MALRCRIRYNLESIQKVVAQKAAYTFPQPGEWQSVCPVWVLERRQGHLELQLARQ